MWTRQSNFYMQMNHFRLNGNPCTRLVTSGKHYSDRKKFNVLSTVNGPKASHSTLQGQEYSTFCLPCKYAQHNISFFGIILTPLCKILDPSCIELFSWSEWCLPLDVMYLPLNFWNRQTISLAHPIHGGYNICPARTSSIIKIE